MKTKLLLSIAIAVVAVLLVLNKKNKQTEVALVEKTTAIKKTEVSTPTLNPIKPTSPSTTLVEKSQVAATTKKTTAEVTPLYPQGPLTVPEVESVNNIVKTISQAISKKSNSTQFMKAIQALHLLPKFIDEGSNAVGSMVTVRTHDALEGTRYLHAQFAGEKNNANYLEHISFQIRRGSNSFQKAVEILNQYLPKNKKIKESASDYVLYNTDDGYVAWAKIATREDLKSNKYNASSKEDVGSIIVTIEQEIHDMDHDGHSH